MNEEEIRAVISTALPMRPPKFEPGTSGAQKVSALEDYLMESAFAHAELEEALHWLDALMAHYQSQVEQITGFEVALPRKPRDRITRDDVLRAKRTVDPTTFEVGATAKQLRQSVLRQIERFRHEYAVVSRCYTMISGS